jgi:hypothetical protein
LAAKLTGNSKMIRKHTVSIGLFIALACLFTAIAIYPGGTYKDRNAEGFDWTSNFISNLFEVKALNGADNPSRFWAYAGMILLPVSYAVFFWRMSKKLPEKNARVILKYASLANILCMFLIVTSLHDLMLNISITLFWTCILVTTIYMLKTKLPILKVFCLLCLAIFYTSIYFWATNNWAVLPSIQKLNFINSTLLILALEYFTSQEDFAHIKSKRVKKLSSLA